MYTHTHSQCWLSVAHGPLLVCDMNISCCLFSLCIALLWYHHIPWYSKGRKSFAWCCLIYQNLSFIIIITTTLFLWFLLEQWTFFPILFLVTKSSESVLVSLLWFVLILSLLSDLSTGSLLQDSEAALWPSSRCWLNGEARWGSCSSLRLPCSYSCCCGP